MHTILRILGLVALFASAQVFAKCDKGSPNTFAINECSEEAFKVVESQLNAAYKQVSVLLTSPSNDLDNPAEIRKYLIAAQRAWIMFRENDCLAQDIATGNATIRAGYFFCMQAHAEIRTKQLQDLLVGLKHYVQQRS